jgi:hypothetical protein
MFSLSSHLSLHGAGKEALKEKLLHPSSFNSPANIGQIKEKRTSSNRTCRTQISTIEALDMSSCSFSEMLTTLKPDLLISDFFSHGFWQRLYRSIL